MKIVSIKDFCIFLTYALYDRFTAVVRSGFTNLSKSENTETVYFYWKSKVKDVTVL